MSMKGMEGPKSKRDLPANWEDEKDTALRDWMLFIKQKSKRNKERDEATQGSCKLHKVGRKRAKGEGALMTTRRRARTDENQRGERQCVI